MTATWIETAPDDAARLATSGRLLRLVAEGGGPRAGERGECGLEPRVPPLSLGSEGNRGGTRRAHVSVDVRRRRALLAIIGLLLIALALPLSGTGGYSHPSGSALAENRGPIVYTVQPGDSLWSIVERLDPTADPRPLVAKLAALTGSEAVRPGERIVLP